MSNTLQVNRGQKANLPVLNQGELAFVTDEDASYVGDGAVNHRHTMKGDTDLTGFGWFLDEDGMASNDATKVSSQQSIKAYFDNNQYTDSEARSAIEAGSISKVVFTNDKAFADASSYIYARVESTGATLPFQCQAIGMDNSGSNIWFDGTPSTLGQDGASDRQPLLWDNGTGNWSPNGNPKLNRVDFDSEHDNGTVSTNTTVDWANGQYQKITLGANLTLSWSNLGVGHKQLKIIQDATGGRTPTLPAGKWLDGTAGSFSTAAGAEDILSIYYDGTNYYYQVGYWA